MPPISFHGAPEALVIHFSRGKFLVLTHMGAPFIFRSLFRLWWTTVWPSEDPWYLQFGSIWLIFLPAAKVFWAASRKGQFIEESLGWKNGGESPGPSREVTVFFCWDALAMLLLAKWWWMQTFRANLVNSSLAAWQYAEDPHQWGRIQTCGEYDPWVRGYNKMFIEQSETQKAREILNSLLDTVIYRVEVLSLWSKWSWMMTSW